MHTSLLSASENAATAATAIAAPAPNFDSIDDQGDRLSIITTKQGDQGRTTLGDGTWLPKQHPRIQLLGEVDELNAHLGLIYAQLIVKIETDANININTAAFDELKASLSTWLDLQNELFNIGGEVSIPGYSLFQKSALERLELANRKISADLPPLKEFILPTGSIISAELHITRTIARRAERSFWQLYSTELESTGMATVNIIIGQYLNRISDYVFNYVRWYHQINAIKHVCWQR